MLKMFQSVELSLSSIKSYFNSNGFFRGDSSMMIMVSFVAIAASSFILLVMRNRGSRYKKLPPGKMGWPLIGETLELISAYKTSNPEPFAETRKAKYGPIFRTHLLGKPTIFSTDAEFNKFVLHNEGRLFASSYPMSLVSLLGKNSLLLTHGYLHKQLYSLTWRFTNSSALKDHLMDDVERHVISTLSTWKAPGNATSTIFIQDEAKKITFNLSISQLLSASPGEWTEKLRQEYLLLIEGFFSLPLNLPGTTYGRALQARSEIAVQVKQVVEHRKQENYNKSTEDNLNGEEVEVDLLSALLKQNMSDEQIVDMIISLLVAGYETTSMIITLAVKFLTDNPKSLQKLKEEHMEIKQRKKPGEKLQWSDYKSMSFTQCVINETLRMGNMVSGVFRKALQDVEFQEFIIPKGWVVFTSFRGVHFDEAHHKDAHEFNPWRWMTDSSTPSTSSVGNIKFTPFGGGPRLCPGYELARVEISVFLHYLTTQFSWQAAEDDEIIFFPTTRMVKRLPVKIKPLPEEP